MTGSTPVYEKRQFIILDALRFLAACLIVVFHYEIFALKNDAGAGRHFGGFDAAVDFFFILSGFVIAYSSADQVSTLTSYAGFLRRRLARIYPLHLLTLAAALAMSKAAGLAGVPLGDAGRYAVEKLPANLFLVQAWGVHERLTFNIVSWSISVEWFLYLVFPLLLAVALRLGPYLTVGAVVLMLVALRSAEAHWGLIAWNDRTYNFGIVRGIPTFVLGIAIWDVWRRHRDARNIPVAVVFLIFAASVAGMYLRVPHEVLIAIFGLIVLCGSFTAPERQNSLAIRIAKRLGNASYSLYMLHYLIGIVVFSVIGQRFGLPLAASIVLASCLSLAASLLSFTFFENPVRRFLSGRQSAAQASSQDSRERLRCSGSRNWR